MENKRRKQFNVEELELSKPGYANGISLQLAKLIEKGEHRSLNEKEKFRIAKRASKYFGKFLTELGVDWENDPNSCETPLRVAKSFVFDLFEGRYNLLSDISSFPSDGYKGIILERDIPIVSQCSHHLQTIMGKVHIAYIPGTDQKVIGLSKMNRIVEHFSRRGAIQEALTMAIHNAIDKVVEGNQGVMVIMQATHNCVACRGVKHIGASMITSEVSGVFSDHTRTAKKEVLGLLQLTID